MIRRILALFRRRKAWTLKQRLTDYNRGHDQYMEQLRRGDPLP
jgi:hypothetical protein